MGLVELEFILSACKIDCRSFKSISGMSQTAIYYIINIKGSLNNAHCWASHFIQDSVTAKKTGRAQYSFMLSMQSSSLLCCLHFVIIQCFSGSPSWHVPHIFCDSSFPFCALSIPFEAGGHLSEAAANLPPHLLVFHFV